MVSSDQDSPLGSWDAARAGNNVLMSLLQFLAPACPGNSLLSFSFCPANIEDLLRG